jgi:hypothetical protein
MGYLLSLKMFLNSDYYLIITQQPNKSNQCMWCIKELAAGAFYTICGGWEGFAR